MLENYPKISVVCPTLNQGRFIERCILSVLNQNYPNLEFIIIDGGSIDETYSIIEKYKDQLTYWISEKDKGQSDAINKGLKKATGDIINWLNSDDYLEKDSLLAIAKQFNENAFDLLCGYSVLHQNGATILKRSSELGNDLDAFIAQGHIMQPSTFWNAKTLSRFCPIATKLHFMMDHHLWLNYFCNTLPTNVIYTDRVLAHVEYHEDAKSVKNLLKFRSDRSMIFNSLFKSRKKQLITPQINNQEPETLPFEFNALVKLKLEKINFLYLIQILYFRDWQGNRAGLNRPVLVLLLKHYPLKFANWATKRMMSL